MIGQNDSAHAIIEALGKLGICEFRDVHRPRSSNRRAAIPYAPRVHGVTHGCISLVQMNKGASPMDPKRFFKDDVKKCEELERVLSNINAELQVSRRRHPVPLSQRLYQMAAFNLHPAPCTLPCMPPSCL